MDINITIRQTVFECLGICVYGNQRINISQCSYQLHFLPSFNLSSVSYTAGYSWILPERQFTTYSTQVLWSHICFALEWVFGSPSIWPFKSGSLMSSWAEISPASSPVSSPPSSPSKPAPFPLSLKLPPDTELLHCSCRLSPSLGCHWIPQRDCPSNRWPHSSAPSLVLCVSGSLGFASGQSTACLRVAAEGLPSPQETDQMLL